MNGIITFVLTISILFFSELITIILFCKKDNVFFSMLNASYYYLIICIVLGAILTEFIEVVTFVNVEIISATILLSSLINAIICGIIFIFKNSELHKISCYDFDFKTYKEFATHMKKELIRLDFSEHKVKKNITLYCRNIGGLEVRALCYVSELNKTVYKEIKKDIDVFLNKYRLTLLNNGMSLSIIMFADKVCDLNEIVINAGIMFNKGLACFRLPVVIDGLNSKLYICDNDNVEGLKQKKLAYKTLNHIYRTVLEEDKNL